jgi:hypothetical protein
MARRSWIPLLVLLAAGCTDTSGPVDVYVVHYDPLVKDFRLEPQRIDTIESIAQVRGGVTRLVKEPNVVVQGDSIAFEGGAAPAVLYSERGGTVVPQDWDSLTLLSYYHHLEQTASWYHTAVGFDSSAIVPLPSYYRVETGIDPNLTGFTDNAAYVAQAHAFLLFDSFFIHDIPLAMNDGVITHEMGHAVFHHVMNGSDRTPIEERDDWPDDARANLAGLHEGQSDLYAACELDEPDFIAFSIPSATDRDMRVHRVLTPELLAQLDDGTAEPHEVGAVIAAAGWAIAESIGTARTAVVLYSAENALLPDLTPSFRISDFLNRFAAAGTPAENAVSCTVFCDRFALIASEITACSCP